MSNLLFEVIAGRSSKYLKIGDVQFEAAPLTILEYAEFLAMPTDERGNVLLDEKAAFIAEKLRKRVRGTKTDPAVITTDWVMENLPVTHLRILDHVFLHGEMPDANEKKAGG